MWPFSSDRRGATGPDDGCDHHHWSDETRIASRWFEERWLKRAGPSSLEAPIVEYSRPPRSPDFHETEHVLAVRHTKERHCVHDGCHATTQDSPETVGYLPVNVENGLMTKEDVFGE